MDAVLSLLPEIVGILAVIFLFIMSVRRCNCKVGFNIWQLIIAAGVVASVVSLSSSAVLFGGVYKVDLMSQFYKLIIFAGFFVLSFLLINNKLVGEDKKVDYLLLLSLSVLGLLFLVSSVELITIYIALELASYAFFAVVPLRAESKEAAEAGIKYIMFSAVMTAISLYGLSFIYADAHTTFLTGFSSIEWSFNVHPMATFGLILFLTGFLFKLALFPFHFWAPDVYEGMANETAAYGATLPKLGSLVVLMRILEAVYPSAAVALVLSVFAALAMTVGNISALVQSDLKRVLGYSAVAHAGYMTVALLVQTKEAVSTVAFYGVVYVVMNILIFWIISRLSPDGRNLKYKDLSGLYKKSPVFAFALAVAVMALIGLPPTGGFIGKFFLLTSAWNKGFNWLIIVAGLNTAIAAYYYLKFIKYAYTEEKENEEEVTVSTFDSIVALLLSVVVFVLGIIPSSVLSIAVKAADLVK